MQTRTTKFGSVKIFIPDVHVDERGFFMESFNSEIQNELGVDFRQDNHSKSYKNVLRGLHYQWAPPMGKLLRVVKGSGLDCIVDIRQESPTFGEHELFLLTENNYYELWVPPGFAQGFLALEDDTHLCYKASALYNGDAEGALHPLDMQLDINWGIEHDQIILSDKDKAAQSFGDYLEKTKF
jgi:dTDP-4-dehydrorhamnose 3,5-epimerase